MEAARFPWWFVIKPEAPIHSNRTFLGLIVPAEVGRIWDCLGSFRDWRDNPLQLPAGLSNDITRAIEPPQPESFELPVRGTQPNPAPNVCTIHPVVGANADNVSVSGIALVTEVEILEIVRLEGVEACLVQWREINEEKSWEDEADVIAAAICPEDVEEHPSDVVFWRNMRISLKCLVRSRQINYRLIHSMTFLPRRWGTTTGSLLSFPASPDLLGGAITGLVRGSLHRLLRLIYTQGPKWSATPCTVQNITWGKKV